MDAAVTAVLGFVRHVFKAAIDHRFERVEFLVDTPGGGVATAAALSITSARAARTAPITVATSADCLAGPRIGAGSARAQCFSRALRLAIVTPVIAGPPAARTAAPWLALRALRRAFDGSSLTTWRGIAGSRRRTPTPPTMWKLALCTRCAKGSSSVSAVARLGLTSGRRGLHKTRLQTRRAGKLATAAHGPPQIMPGTLRACPHFAAGGFA
jgi:hypothetical protein